MNEKTKKGCFRGVATALVSPFSDGKTDLFTFRRLINIQLGAKIDALVVAGTTGEAPTLTDKERDALLSEALDCVDGRIPVIMGCGSNDTAHAISYARRAKELGADAALVVTPYYNKGTHRGLCEHFLRVAEEGKLPVILYNVPSRTGVDLTLEEYDELFSHPLTVGAKEASASIEKMAELCALAKGRAAVYTGNDAMTLPSLAVGADGVISVASGVLPRNMRRIYSSFSSGEWETAAKVNERLMRFYRLLFKETNPAPVKCALSLLGFGDGSLRLPLTPPSEALEKELKEELERLAEGV